MVRTQIQLTETQARRLRDRARREGVSLAEVIRRYVDRGLSAELSERARRYEQAAQVIGRFRDRRCARDVARDHDRYLDEAFE